MDFRKEITRIIENKDSKEDIEKAINDFMGKYCIEPDDTFVFGCHACGNCCKHRDDLIITPRDVFHIAQKLETTIENIIDTYCDTYIGDTSKLPIVRIKPVGITHQCPFLEGNRCSIHDAKPTICAIFPLGRLYSHQSKSEEKIKYFLQPTNCGSRRKKHTLRNWLNEFGIDINDSFFISWSSVIPQLVMFIRWLQDNNIDPKEISGFLLIIFNYLYINYDTNSDFLMQFNKNVDKLKSLLQNAKSSPEETLNRYFNEIFK